MLRATGLIGNCQYAAHANAWGEIVWLCMPRFDSEPIFGKLIDEQSGGHFRIAPPAGGEGAQRYETNTNILVTTFADASGSFRVIDFAPRFEHNGRSFRPTQLVRIVEPISGTPQVRVDIAPVLGFSKKAPQVEQGSHHLRFLGYDAELRLTTDMPLSYVNQREMTLTKPLYFMLSYGPPLEGQLDEVCGRFLRQTTDYWQKWVKHCNVPPLHQDAVIRSALALKLHCFEDTGAIVASTTTSLPESAGAGRNWDYRYCWLRDAYYALKAFRSLGHFEEREQFLQFLLNVVGSAPDLQLQPLYRIDGSPNLEESILTEWAGFRGEKPVRLGNGAYSQLQHDVYGEMVLALTPIFVDQRFSAERNAQTEDLYFALADKAISVAGTADAGIWEFRHANLVQTFSTMMSWAAASRATQRARTLRPERAAHFEQAAKRLADLINDKAYHPSLQSYASAFGSTTIDAALLEMITLRMPLPQDRLRSTVRTIQRDLTRSNGWLMRYKHEDGFDESNVSFIICTFWLIEALCVLGDKAQARGLLADIVSRLPPLGLLSEDIADDGELWGNFPQAYSHVGLINAAFAAAPDWNEV